MEKEIAKRYRLCTNCSDRILSGSCDGKCKEYWKYVGATEQKAIDIEKAKNAFDKAHGWLSIYPWYNSVAKEFMKILEEQI